MELRKIIISNSLIKNIFTPHRRNSEFCIICPPQDSEQIGYIFTFRWRTFKLKVNSFPPLTVCFSVRSSATWLHGQINNICNLSFVDQFNVLTRILVARQKRVGGNINIVWRSYQYVHGIEETKVILKKYCFGIDLCFEANSAYFGNLIFCPFSKNILRVEIPQKGWNSLYPTFSEHRSCSLFVKNW